VTRTRCFLCGDCLKLPDSCYLCGMPVLKGFTKLPDGRAICERDTRTAVLDDGEATRICERIRSDLDHQFARFIAFPGANVTLELMDRVTLQELYKVIGNDFSCPNTLGCTQTKSNATGLTFKISLLSGLPRERLITTCVHEYTHAWINENMPPTRRKTIGKDAVEGFCELVSYMLATEQGLESGKSEILNSRYTRGQIHLFIQAEREFGFNEIVDWMKSGEDALLKTNALARVRQLDAPRTTAQSPNRKATPSFARRSAPAFNPATLVLNGIIWSKTRPMASINHKNFVVNDEAPVPLGKTNVTIRCLAIREDSVTIQIVGTGETRELRMK